MTFELKCAFNQVTIRIPIHFFQGIKNIEMCIRMQRNLEKPEYFQERRTALEGLSYTDFMTCPKW